MPEGPGGHTGEHDCSAEEVAEHDNNNQQMFITLPPSRSVESICGGDLRWTHKAMTRTVQKTTGKRP